jgi:hypothetical protein
VKKIMKKEKCYLNVVDLFKNPINKSTKNWSHMKKKISQQHLYNY